MTKALEITFTTFQKLNLEELCRVIQDMLPIKKWSKLGYQTSKGSFECPSYKSSTRSGCNTRTIFGYHYAGGVSIGKCGINNMTLHQKYEFITSMTTFVVVYDTHHYMTPQSRRIHCFYHNIYDNNNMVDDMVRFPPKNKIIKIFRFNDKCVYINLFELDRQT